MDDVYPVYERLWRRAQAEGAIVRYEGLAPNGEAGWFHPTYYPKPTIIVMRPYYKEDDQPARDSNAPPPLAQPNIHEELITLAHEYGHFRSWAGRTERSKYNLYDVAAERRDAITAEVISKMPEGLSKQEHWERRRTAVRAALGADDLTRIIGEETLAWEVGREVLAELGLTDFALYDERMRRGLHYHRYRLGIDELRPDDV